MTANETTKHILVWDKTPSATLSMVPAVIGLLLGIFWGLQIHWVLGTIVVFASLLGTGFIINNAQTELRNGKIDEFEALCEQHGLVYKPNFSNPERDLQLGLSESDHRMLVQFRISDFEVKERFINVRDILSVELAADDTAIYRAGPIASLSAAAVGGATFGGAGAIVGSLSASRIGSGKVAKLSLKLRVNDINEPLIEVPLVYKPAKTSDPDTQSRLALSEKWIHLVEVMRFRLANPSTPTPLPETA